jgi:hypothetical protein
MQEIIEKIEDCEFDLKSNNVAYNPHSKHLVGYRITTDKQTILIGIEDFQGCCENWGYLTTEDSINDFIGAEIVGIEVIDDSYETHPLTKDSSVANWESDETVVVFIDVNTSRGKLQFVAYNEQNGYYGHTVIVSSNQFSYEKII